MIKQATLMATLLTLTVSCGIPRLPLSGPNVAANVQAGQTNHQTLGRTETVSQSVKDSHAEQIRQSADTNQISVGQVKTLVQNQTPPWLIIAFAVALFLDSPLRWPAEIVAAFRRRNGKPHKT
jgi:hypothetical protein